MVILPPELRSYDGHPHAELAAAVMADLAKVGVPVRVVDLDAEDSHVDAGVSLSLDGPGPGVSLSWYVPNEVTHSASERKEKEQVFGAAATLTSAVISILTNFGHRVVTRFEDPGYPYPYINVLAAETPR
ncbi:hypothetical protein ACWD5V_39245 [Streptomyces sp. NPDC002523]